MADPDEGSVLILHHRDVSTVIGTNVGYYLADTLSESHTVHVVCRKRESERTGAHDQRAKLYDIDTGEVPVLSTILFQVVATLYVALLGVRYRYDTVYSFQSSTIQGQVGAWFAGARYVVGLVSVPVRQSQDMIEHGGSGPGLRDRVAMSLMSVYGAIVGHLLGRSTDVVFTTEGILEVTEAVYGIDLSDAYVLGTGVDVEKFASAGGADRDPGGVGSGPGENGGVDDEGASTLTYIGAINGTRKLEVVVEALAELDRDVTLLLAGQGPDEYRQTLLERAEELGVADQVDWLGLVPHQEIPELLARSTVTLSPLPDIESYQVSSPAKLLEYMAAGTQVVASDIHPHRMLIDDGENGYLYDGSRAGLVAAVERALDDDRDAVARRAQATARDYDWDVVVARYEQVIFGTAPEASRADIDLREGQRSSPWSEQDEGSRLEDDQRSGRPAERATRREGDPQEG